MRGTVGVHYSPESSEMEDVCSQEYYDIIIDNPLVIDESIILDNDNCECGHDDAANALMGDLNDNNEGGNALIIDECSKPEDDQHSVEAGDKNFINENDTLFNDGKRDTVNELDGASENVNANVAVFDGEKINSRNSFLLDHEYGYTTGSLNSIVYNLNNATIARASERVQVLYDEKFSHNLDGGNHCSKLGECSHTLLTSALNRKLQVDNDIVDLEHNYTKMEDKIEQVLNSNRKDYETRTMDNYNIGDLKDTLQGQFLQNESQDDHKSIVSKTIKSLGSLDDFNTNTALNENGVLCQEEWISRSTPMKMNSNISDLSITNAMRPLSPFGSKGLCYTDSDCLGASVCKESDSRKSSFTKVHTLSGSLMKRKKILSGSVLKSDRRNPTSKQLMKDYLSGKEKVRAEEVVKVDFSKKDERKSDNFTTILEERNSIEKINQMLGISANKRLLDVDSILTNCLDIKPDIQQLAGISGSTEAASSNIDCETPDVKVIRCKECCMVFNNMGDFDIHLIICDVDAKKAKICSICRVAFPDLKSFNSHDCCRNAEKNDYTCGVCNKAFKKRDVVYTHLKIHASVKEFVCEVCQKQFLHKHHLTYHMKSHANERPYKCQVCSSTFKRQSNLQKHQNSHKPVADRKFKCSVCDWSFHEKYKLQRHEQTHSATPRSYICGICKKSFREKYILNKHMRCIHSDAAARSHIRPKKQLECKICGLTFFWKKHLRNHMNAHPDAGSD